MITGSLFLVVQVVIRCLDVAIAYLRCNVSKEPSSGPRTVFLVHHGRMSN